MNSKVLVIIVSYNSSDYIGDCLSSLQKTIYPQDHFEVLVVDNASTDNCTAVIKKDFPSVALIELEANIGFAGGNNVGFHYAIDHGFDYIYLLNQDTEVTPDFLTEVVQIMQTDPKIGAVQSKLMLFDSPELINSTGNELHFLGFGYAGDYKVRDYQMDSREITYPSGAAVLVSVAAAQRVGGLFDEAFFMYHEDTDLGWRLWLGGYRCVLAPKSVVYHKYEFSRSISKYYWMERNRYLIVLRNYSLWTLILIFPAFILTELGLMLLAIKGGWWREKLRAWGFILNPAHWPRIAKARKQVQKNRRVGDREVVKRFAGKIAFQEVDSPLLRYIANPILGLYWVFAKLFVR